MDKLDILLAGAIVATFAAYALPVDAETYVSVGPPEPRIEHFEPRAGQVVIPGVWEWRHGKHEWLAGHYAAARKGYHYQGDHWVMHEHNQWTMQRGGWSRDSDGGGMGKGMGDHMDGRSNGPRR